MNLDEKLTNALSEDSAKIDKMMATEEGLFARAFGLFKSSMKVWVILVNVCILIFTGLFLWCFYEFWMAPNVDMRIFWGVCFIATFHAQVAMKMWLFWEMNRQSTIREIKRVEIELARLQQRL